jgi:hypothetical protein
MPANASSTPGSGVLDWDRINANLDREGFHVIPGLLSEREGEELLAAAASSKPTHSHVLSNGQTWLPDLGRHLEHVARRWEQIQIGKLDDSGGVEQGSMRHPDDSIEVASFEASRLGGGESQMLHQRADEEDIFPLQLIALLTEPGTQFFGGHFVMTEQRPRMQSRPIVIPLRRGDVAIISVARRPFNGSSGYYRVNMKHAISRVTAGTRVGLEVFFRWSKH